MQNTQCASCCFNCRAVCTPSPSSSTDAVDPYHPHNLLKAGILSVQLGQGSQPEVYCEHRHASDGWHPYSGAEPFLPLTSLNDVNLCKQLEFLTKHKFLLATYQVRGGEKLILRIYLAPYDLPGARGALRMRAENVLGPARKYMRGILPMIVNDPVSWEGGDSIEGTCLLPDTKDPRSLSEIYSDLASPIANPVPGLGNISQRLLDYDDDLKGLGLRSTLYRYQRRSVAAMLQKELDTRDVPDPLFVPVTTVDGRQFFFQPGTMEVLLDRPLAAPCRGGILCEELGTGKTVMVISLVLATLRQLPKPEESMVDDRPTMTPLSFRHFPSMDCMTARARLVYKGKERECRVPTLVELLLDCCRVSPDESVPNLKMERGVQRERKLEALEETLDNLPLGKLRKANTPFYFHYPGEPTSCDRNRRKQIVPAPKRMYLSPATLVVVPPNLLGQWDREIIKHSEHPLRVLVVRNKTDIPPVKSLTVDYDIVLMTYTSFTQESKGSTSKLHSMRACTCPEIPGSSIPDCQCLVSEVSPLLQIRWKRLVIDEGHVSASLSTYLTPCTKSLSIERRWIVTGTPTTNLLGLSLGQQTIEDLTNSEVETPENNSESILVPSSSIPLCNSPTFSISDSWVGRIWDNDDRGDLRKLGNMITHFISVPQFAADTKLMTTHVTDPLLDPKGPRSGSIQVLNQVMHMVMIRHRIENIEDDVVLPPLMHESVLLDLHPFAIKSYNALQASIAVNAVDSERTDKDYLFHPTNANLLQLTMKNMSQIMFWSVDESHYHVQQLHQDAQKHLERAISRNRPPKDIALLKDAFHHIGIAAKDTTWNLIHSHEDIPYHVYSMPTGVFDAWTRIPLNTSFSDSHVSGFLSIDRLLKLYEVVLKRPLTTADGMIEHGHWVSQSDTQLREAYLDAQKKSRKGAGHRSSQFQTDLTTHSQIASTAVKKASAKETLDAVKAVLKDTMATMEGEPNDNEDAAHHQRAGTQRSTKLSKLAHNSPLAKVRIGPSASNKLNYIIDQVLKYSATEKFLIFTDSELTLAHIAEALELVHIKHLRFSTQIPARNREQLVLTFETSETYRVFLMELKHGARGLNLVSASRVIFCEPVWQADVESQAIKRAHRIGQTKPITVKTLAIRGTAEENMVALRHTLKNSHDKVPKLTEEAGMRHFISNPKFIETPPTMVDIDVPLLDLLPLDIPHSTTVKVKRPQSVTQSPRKRVWLMDPLSGQETEGPSVPRPSVKRPRVIKFVT